MIRIFKRLYFRVIRTVFPGPVGANRPVFILVEDSGDENETEQGGMTASYSKLKSSQYYPTRDEIMRDNPAV